MKMTFKDWLLNQNYTLQDYDKLDTHHQFELIKAYLKGEDCE